jgi:hypothetical protein
MPHGLECFFSERDIPVGSWITAAGAADLSITKTHVGNFTQGQAGAAYTITVTAHQ